MRRLFIFQHFLASLARARKKEWELIFLNTHTPLKRSRTRHTFLSDDTSASQFLLLKYFCNTKHPSFLFPYIHVCTLYLYICFFSVFVKGTCGGPCCNREKEDRLRYQARADFHSLIHHHSRSLQGLLATTAVALRGKFYLSISHLQKNISK